jgi:hypothetical protein
MTAQSNAESDRSPVPVRTSLSDAGVETAAGSADHLGIDPESLVPDEGRLGGARLRCPHPDCSWWVPEDRAHLAAAHRCTGPVYEAIDRSELVSVGPETTPEAYVEHFVGYDGQLDFRALAEDARQRPRSERLALLFDFTPFDYQRAMLDDPHPDVSVNTGRQTGKTETGGALAADAVLFDTYLTDDDVGIFGDVHGTAMEMFRRCKNRLKQSPLPLDALHIDRDNETFWEWDNDTRVFTGSLNGGGDNERGKLPKVVIVDEAALCERSSFEQVVEPMFMTHGDDHELYVMSTPRGQTGYHYSANDPEREPDYFSAHSVPAWANPRTASTWLRKKQANTDSDTWRQEYRGEFIEEGNTYIPSSLYRPCQTDLGVDRRGTALTVPGHPERGIAYFGGCDVAGGGDDRTVYIVLAADGTVVHIEAEDTSKTPQVVGRIGALVNRYNIVEFRVDGNSLGTGVVDYSEVDDSLQPVVEGVPFSTPRKSKMYKQLKKAFEDEALALPKHARLERETTRLQYEYTGNRHVKVSHPENGHDDHPDALALANSARVGDPSEQDGFLVTR